MPLSCMVLKRRLYNHTNTRENISPTQHRNWATWETENIFWFPAWMHVTAAAFKFNFQAKHKIGSREFVKLSNCSPTSLIYCYYYESTSFLWKYKTRNAEVTQPTSIFMTALFKPRDLPLTDKFMIVFYYGHIYSTVVCNCKWVWTAIHLLSSLTTTLFLGTVTRVRQVRYGNLQEFSSSQPVNDSATVHRLLMRRHQKDPLTSSLPRSSKTFAHKEEVLWES